MSKKFGLRKGGMQKQSEPVTPQFTQCHHSVGCFFIFPPSFYTVMGTERSRRATKCIGPGPIPIPPSQRKPTWWSVLVRMSIFGVRSSWRMRRISTQEENI